MQLYSCLLKDTVPVCGRNNYTPQCTLLSIACWCSEALCITSMGLNLPGSLIIARNPKGETAGSVARQAGKRDAVPLGRC